MCGVNGFHFFVPRSASENEKLIKEMNKQIYHRGPDENGDYSDSSVSIGMTRLSIIDLSTGKQPISNEDGTLKMVFNGEIYNFKELRDELKEKGHIFTTLSDTEVIIHAFEEYGVDCPKKLKGMFAFAIYNTNDGSVFLARDRIGEKPLYYSVTDKYFIFASELKSILTANLIEKKINKTALAQYMALSYIPAPLSILENVYKLKAAHYMIVSKDGTVKTEKYWDVVYDDNNLIYDYNECKNQLRDTLFGAVEKCMVSDVPIGTFLSGGIDSTIITGIMSKLSSSQVNTFTIGFKNKAYDESELALLVSKKYNTKHHVFYIDYDDMLNSIQKIIANIDEPFADSSYISTYTVSKLAAQEVKTVLTGDSGDELFGGYEKYLIGYYSGKYNKIPSVIRRSVIENLVHALPDNNSKTRKIRKVIDNAGTDIFSQRRNLMCLAVRYDELEQLLNYEFTDSFNFVSEYYNKYNVSNELDRALYTDLKVVLEGDMLCKVDRASMLASLETRVPMLYPDVVELAARIPAEYKISSGRKKIILKDTFSDLIPDQLLTAPKKGFSVPMAEWLRGELKEDLISTLGKNMIAEQGLFNYEYIEKLMNDHFSAKRNNSGALWALYIFEKWYGNYFKK